MARIDSFCAGSLSSLSSRSFPSVSSLATSYIYWIRRDRRPFLCATIAILPKMYSIFCDFPKWIFYCFFLFSPSRRIFSWLCQRNSHNHYFQFGTIAGSLVDPAAQWCFGGNPHRLWLQYVSQLAVVAWVAQHQLWARMVLVARLPPNNYCQPANSWCRYITLQPLIIVRILL